MLDWILFPNIHAAIFRGIDVQVTVHHDKFL